MAASPDSPAPKRRLPRFSLITLIVAVNVAGVLVWANLSGQTIEAAAFYQSERRSYGWPMAGCIRDWTIVDFHVESEVFQPSFGSTYYWMIDGFALNAATAISIIVVLALLTEFLVRRFRKAKRHDG